MNIKKDNAMSLQTADREGEIMQEIVVYCLCLNPRGIGRLLMCLVCGYLLEHQSKVGLLARQFSAANWSNIHEK